MIVIVTVKRRHNAAASAGTMIPQVGRQGGLPGGTRGGQVWQGGGPPGPLPVRLRRRGRGLRAGGVPAEVHLPLRLRGRRRACVPTGVGRHHEVRGSSTFSVLWVRELVPGEVGGQASVVDVKVLVVVVVKAVCGEVAGR